MVVEVFYLAIISDNDKNAAKFIFKFLSSPSHPEVFKLQVKEILENETKLAKLKECIQRCVLETRAGLHERIKLYFGEETTLFVGSNRQDHSKDTEDTRFYIASIEPNAKKNINSHTSALGHRKSAALDT